MYRWYCFCRGYGPAYYYREFCWCYAGTGYKGCSIFGPTSPWNGWRAAWLFGNSCLDSLRRSLQSLSQEYRKIYWGYNASEGTPSPYWKVDTQIPSKDHDQSWWFDGSSSQVGLGLCSDNLLMSTSDFKGTSFSIWRMESMFRKATIPLWHLSNVQMRTSIKPLFLVLFWSTFSLYFENFLNGFLEWVLWKLHDGGHVIHWRWLKRRTGLRCSRS